MLAVVLVAITVLTVGLVAKLVLPDLPWAVCFLLGAIVSPTDTVAVQTVIEKPAHLLCRCHDRALR
jgi:CPA1 family monovalent cation:H+ antiporter